MHRQKLCPARLTYCSSLLSPSCLLTPFRGWWRELLNNKRALTTSAELSDRRVCQHSHSGRWEPGLREAEVLLALCTSMRTDQSYIGPTVPTHPACSNHLFLGQPAATFDSLLLGEPSHYSSIKNSEMDMQVLIAGCRCLKGPRWLPLLGAEPQSGRLVEMGLQEGSLPSQNAAECSGPGQGQSGAHGGRGRVVPSHPP